MRARRLAQPALLNADSHAIPGFCHPHCTATHHFMGEFHRDWAAEVAYFPSEIIEHALAHNLKDEAEATHQRGDMLLKRAILMQQWARFCSQPVSEIRATLATAMRDFGGVSGMV